MERGRELMYIRPAQHPWYDGTARYGLRVRLSVAVILILLPGLNPAGFLDGASSAAGAE